MSGPAPDFVAVGGPDSHAPFAALTAVRLGRSAGLLTIDPLPQEQRTTIVSAGVEIAFGSDRLRAEHVPWSWLDAEIVLAAPTADEIDAPLLGRFSRSLIGIVGESGAGFPGIGAHFLTEGQAVSDPDAPIALTVGPQNGARLWWQDGWRDIASEGIQAGPTLLAATASAFLIRLTETRDAVSAAHFAAGFAAALPPAPRFSLDDIPTREAIAQRV